MASKFAYIGYVALSTAAAYQLSGGKQVMVVSGISSATEMCLVANGATASLESCSDAVLAGDGREIFSFDNGDLIHNGVKLLSGLELAGNGQLKSNGSCISLAGPAPGTADLALHAAATATSTASASHAAAMAVDGRSTYWASTFDPAVPVELSVDLGHGAKLESASIQWEYPAQSFSVLLSDDGVHWSEAYSTDANVLKTTHVPLGGKISNKAKVVLREAHPVYGKIRGKSIFGISSLSLFSNQMEIVTEECSHAEQSADARDKFFIVAATAQDDAPRSRLRTVLPALDVASSSLSATTAAVFETMPLVSSCAGAGEGLLAGVKSARKQESHGLVAGGQGAGAARGTVEVDLESTAMLFQTARAAIVDLRAAIG